MRTTLPLLILAGTLIATTPEPEATQAKPSIAATGLQAQETDKTPKQTTGSQKKELAVALDLKGIGELNVASMRTKDFLTKLGYDPRFPTGDPADGIWIKHDDNPITVRALPNEKGLDRLVISCGIRGKGPASLRNFAALKAINELNANMNVCTFSLDGNGDLELSTNLGFCDTLEYRHFREHVEHLLGFAEFFTNTDEEMVSKAREVLLKE